MRRGKVPAPLGEFGRGEELRKLFVLKVGNQHDLLAKRELERGRRK
jgi:hypothetical protein